MASFIKIMSDKTTHKSKNCQKQRIEQEKRNKFDALYLYRMWKSYKLRPRPRTIF